MQGTAIDGAIQPPRWTTGVVVKVRFGARRDRPALTEAERIALVERVLCDKQLDHATRLQLARILAITVQDWAARK